MTATELIKSTLPYLQALSGFILLFGAIACAEELIGLVRKATAAVNRRRGW